MNNKNWLTESWCVMDPQALCGNQTVFLSVNAEIS